MRMFLISKGTPLSNTARMMCLWDPWKISRAHGKTLIKSTSVARFGILFITMTNSSTGNLSTWVTCAPGSAISRCRSPEIVHGKLPFGKENRQLLEFQEVTWIFREC